jgi:pimeloyl-ACP methyl ester carboxylesterase
MKEDAKNKLCDWVFIEGNPVPFEISGDGPTLVLVHGGWADHRIWHDVRPHLQKYFTVFAFTLRGFGPWKWSDDSFGLDAHTEDLIKIIDHLEVPVHLAGWSYSGHVLLAAAAARPDNVLSVTDYEPSLGYLLGSSTEDLRALETVNTGLAPTEDLFKSGEGEAGIQAGLEFLFGMRPGGFTDLSDSIKRVFLDNAHTIPKHIHEINPDPLNSQLLSQITCPVTLMSGSETLSIYKQSVETVALMKSDVRTPEIPGVGHGWPVQKPKEFANEVLKFINSVRQVKER